MRRRAADNEYLHKDFHGALSAGIDYLEEHFGPEAVREYIEQFAAAYHGPLTDALSRRGLIALKEHFERLYRIEGGSVKITLDDDELLVEVEACPAVTHMRRNNYPVARLFVETTRTLDRAICRGTPFEAELVEYDEQTGRSLQRFKRRAS